MHDPTLPLTTPAGLRLEPRGSIHTFRVWSGHPWRLLASPGSTLLYLDGNPTPMRCTDIDHALAEIDACRAGDPGSPADVFADPTAPEVSHGG